MSDWRRMIIDSRYKTADSVSNADFYVQLPWNCTVPAGSQLFIDGIVLSHSWNTIIEGQNDTLYLKEVVSGTTDFLYSNSLVAKFCFFVLIVIVSAV